MQKNEIQLLFMDYTEGKGLAETFMRSPELLEKLGALIRNEIASDDEADNKMAYRLLAAYFDNPEIVDDVMMSLSGWTMESLMNKTE